MRELTTLGDAVTHRAHQSGFSGVVSIQRGQATLYSQAFGYRAAAEGLPNETTTRFGIASGTKLLTALGIGCLVDEGELSLKTIVTDFGSDLRGFIDEAATVQDLLTHTSGIYDYYDEESVTDFENYTVDIPWCRLSTPSDYLPLFENRTMKSPRGTRFSYSNGGYVVLGIIIERVSGKLYRDFIELRVLSSAGMTDSGFYAFNALPSNTACGYLADRLTTNIYNLPIRGGGDGGLYSTAADVHALWRRLFSGSILSPALTKTFLATHQRISPTDGYGLGVYKQLDDDRHFIIGSDVGVGFYSSYRQNSDISIVILSNLTDGQREMADFVESLKTDGSWSIQSSRE